MTLQLGDRVAWLGSIDAGRRWVRWVGTVLSTSHRLPYGYVRGDDGELRETGAHLAAVVLHDVPQHGEASHDEVEPRNVIELADLELLEAASRDVTRALSRTVKLHERAALVCTCATHRPPPR